MNKLSYVLFTILLVAAAAFIVTAARLWVIAVFGVVFLLGVAVLRARVVRDASRGNER